METGTAVDAASAQKETAANPTSKSGGVRKTASRKQNAASKKRARKLPTAKTAAIVVRGRNKKRKEEDDGKKPPEKQRLSQFCTAFKATPSENTPKSPGAKSKSHDNDDDAEDGKAGNKNSSLAGPAVQIINGEIVLQESSMILHGNVKPPTEDDDEYQVVEEEDQLGGIGSSYTSFSKKRRRPQKWTVEETQLFYDALRQVGQDFITMESFFTETKRNRKTLKRKYKFESINNPHLVEAAMDPKARRELDLSVFDVSDSDLANIKRPTAPVISEPNEPTVEIEAEAGKKSVEGGKKSVEGGEQAVVEEDAAEQQEVIDETDEPVQQKLSGLADSFWNDEETGQHNGEPTKPSDTAAEIDPVLEEPAETAVQEEDPAPSISLLSRATNVKKKAKRPKFRQRKGKK